VRVSEYNQLKGQLAALNRKRTGNLAVRELAGLVEKEDAVATENLMSLFVVVPKTSKADWTGGYERLSDFVVRRCPSVNVSGGSLASCLAGTVP
jgi:V-type H+-transporting ATPase subunit C